MPVVLLTAYSSDLISKAVSETMSAPNTYSNSIAGITQDSKNKTYLYEREKSFKKTPLELNRSFLGNNGRVVGRRLYNLLRIEVKFFRDIQFKLYLMYKIIGL